MGFSWFRSRGNKRAVAKVRHHAANGIGRNNPHAVLRAALALARPVVVECADSVFTPTCARWDFRFPRRILRFRCSPVGRISAFHIRFNPCYLFETENVIRISYPRTLPPPPNENVAL